MTATKTPVCELLGRPVERGNGGRHRAPGFVIRFYARLWVWLAVLR